MLVGVIVVSEERKGGLLMVSFMLRVGFRGD